MSTIRTLVVDDEPAARRGISLLLADQPGFEVVGECGDGDAAAEAIARMRPDLVFLDIQMPGVDGFETLSRVPEDGLPLVVFVTAYDRYAVRAFEAHALDFLLKPVGRPRFQEACGRARAAIEAKTQGAYSERVLALLASVSDRLASGGADRNGGSGSRFVVKSLGRVTFVDEDAVEWITAARDYARLHTGERSYLIRETMTALEERLDAERWVRVHRSTLVRVDAIREIRLQGDGRCAITLPDGSERKVSRSGRKRLEAALGVSL